MNNKKNWRHLLTIWLPVIIWALVIYSFSSIPTTQVSQIHWEDFIIKKLAHIIEYGVLSTLLYRGFKVQGMELKKQA